MTAPAKLALFGLGLIVVFVASIGVGRAAGPVEDRSDDHDRHPAVTSVESR